MSMSPMPELTDVEAGGSEVLTQHCLHRKSEPSLESHVILPQKMKGEEKGRKDNPLPLSKSSQCTQKIYKQELCNSALYIMDVVPIVNTIDF